MELLLAAAGTRRTGARDEAPRAGAGCRVLRVPTGAFREAFVCVCLFVPMGLLVLTRRGAPLPTVLLAEFHTFFRTDDAEVLDADFPHAVDGAAALALAEADFFGTEDPGAADPIGVAETCVECMHVWLANGGVDNKRAFRLWTRQQREHTGRIM